MSVQEKIALVTGATRGLGFETVRQLARKGVFVLLGARDLAAGQEKAEALRSEGLAVDAIEIDLNRPDTIDAAASTIDARFGKLDILVNNAGILLLDTDDFPSVAPLETLRESYDVNFIGTVIVTQKLLPLIRKASSGRIVNLSSSVGSLWWTGDINNPNPGVKWLGYAASKAAVNMLTVQLAFELKDTPIKVNSVCPGYVMTDLNRGGGYITIEDGVKASVKYALLDDAGPTGQFFNIDGPINW
ncbi:MULTISPECIES: SDR family oxidoreductase [unclassified Bradyrhizobium]|uniref:SDR family oxidoreductase n=1 Tax=unclassified Bradyrhizobium TaxID=2631580 RepID=UPI001BA9AEB9|nr:MULTISPECIES: SDR family oxidoreductase [unclassified Bradyrhizobium]MBR1227679.1 SDR family oxidoreductase [Bradyrhizobium sp. AUGA SZCCT0176]MBR1295588.1 SDR family oxidoreductase [Bradyrhizobium sp. AUGA SZCCT0042]